MDIQPDFKKLLALLNARHVEFLIVGGYALAFHGAPRYTGDIDLFLRPTPENAARVLDALNTFGFQVPNLSEQDFLAPDQVIQLGVPPVRVDLMTSISGVSWEAAESSKVPGFYDDIPVYYIGMKEYVVNKRASGRQKDLADIEALDEL